MTDLDSKRLELIRIFDHLNLSENKELNDLVTLAAEICNVPVAIIALAGEDAPGIIHRVGSKFGSNISLTSFCRYLVDQTEVMVIPDTSLDDRFARAPAAIGDDAIRFYAGAPLATSTGVHLGSLCIFDQRPHSFSANKKKMLAILSRQVMHLIELEISLKLIEERNSELRKQKEKINISERKLRAFFNSSAFCHMLIGRDMEVMDYNKATAVFIKEMYNKQVQTGKCVLDYISPEYRDEFMGCINRAFTGKRNRKEVLLKYEGKGSIWWNIFLEPVKDENGKVTSVVYNATNINDQKQRIAEITAQNEILTNIAYIQSHEYRRPVASILGLMELIKIDSHNGALSEYLVMMERAVKELDEKIKSVVGYVPR